MKPTPLPPPPRADDAADDWLRRFIAPLSRAQAPAARFHLELDRRGLALHDQALPRKTPLRIDFNRRRFHSGPDPLLRAVGARARTVVDATAGWGADAAHLARRGYRVTAIEKNRVVAAMLLHARAACVDAAMRERLRIVYGDSILHLRAASPDVVYLDPMYPPNPKSAATKKALTMLRALADAHEDPRPLFEQAMARATQRVVVKRPHHAPPLGRGKVGETLGKLVRFDIHQPSP